MGDDEVKCLRTISEFLNDNKINFDDELLFWRDFNLDVKATEELQKDENFKDSVAGE